MPGLHIPNAKSATRDRGLTHSASTAANAQATLAYAIGGISFGVFADRGIEMKLDRAVQEFSIAPNAAGKSAHEFDVKIRARMVAELPNPTCTPLFSSGGLWSLFE